MPVPFRHCAIIFLLLNLAVVSFAQRAKKDVPALPVFSLRTSPLSFIEMDGNVMLGLGIRLTERWGINIEPGYVFWRPYADRKEGEKETTSGIKLRSEIRFYLNEYERKVHVFVGAEFHYKYVDYRRWEEFGINCIGGMCDYYQRASYRLNKKEIGGAAKFGMMFPMGSRLSGEVFVGLGFKTTKYKESDIPPAGSFVNEPDRDDIPLMITDGTQEEEPISPLVPFGFKLVYRLF